MRRERLLHVGDVLPLRASRSAILRSHFEVIDCLSREASEVFKTQPHVDAVLICGSIRGTMRNLLVTRIREYAPQTLILEMGTDLRPGAKSAVLIDPHAPQNLLASISRALVEHARVPQAQEPAAAAAVVPHTRPSPG